MTESWRSIDGYDDLYEISNLGRVRSLDRTLEGHRWGGQRRVKGRVLAPNIFPNEYIGFILWKDNQSKCHLAHRLVCAAFNGPAPTAKHVANHIDGDKQNNVPENLEWLTHKENARHAWDDLGYRPSEETMRRRREKQRRGSSVPTAKLKESDIPAIRKRLTAGRTQASIAEDFGVSRRTIGLIKAGRTWAHVQ